MRTICAGLFLMWICGACTQPYDHQGKTPLVELYGNFLYREDLRQAMPPSLSTEDSLRFAQQYIRTWAEDVLLYEKAKDNIPDNADIDRRVNSYRKALIMHTYQQELIHQQLSQEISEQEQLDYYQQHPALFKLDQPLMKGVFIKVPLSAPNLSQVRHWMRTDSHEAVEHLEKYSLQSAVNYEYFCDKWVQVSRVLGLLPLQEVVPDSYFSTHRQIELQDTAYHYFLRVSDYLPSGGDKPFDYAREEVKDMLMNMKQVQFMQKVKDDLYQNAVDKDNIKIYSIEHPE